MAHVMNKAIPLVLCHTWNLAPIGNVLHLGIMCITFTFAMQFAAMVDRTRYATITMAAGTWCASVAYYFAMFCLKDKWTTKCKERAQAALFVCLVAHMCCDKTGTLYCKASWIELFMKSVTPLNVWCDKQMVSCKCDNEERLHVVKVVKSALCVIFLIVCIGFA
jgi:hypothetical protein